MTENKEAPLTILLCLLFVISLPRTMSGYSINGNYAQG